MIVMFINRLYTIRNLFRSIQYFAVYFNIFIGLTMLLFSLFQLSGVDFGLSSQDHIKNFRIIKRIMAIDFIVCMASLGGVIRMDKTIKKYRNRT